MFDGVKKKELAPALFKGFGSRRLVAIPSSPESSEPRGDPGNFDGGGVQTLLSMLKLFDG